MTDSTTYVVKAGDTLSDIAARFTTSVSELAQINQITNVNRINPGQVLKLTRSDTTLAADKKYVNLFVHDGHDLPIKDLEITVNLPSGKKVNAKTTQQGTISLPLPAHAQGTAQVQVKDHSGKNQSVCTLDVSKCTHAVLIRSPKVKVDLTPRSHKQKPPAASTAAPKGGTASEDHWWNATGAFANAWERVKGDISLTSAHAEGLPATKTLTKEGHPVTLVAGPECPNPDNLLLGQNNIYRQAVLDAAKRLGLIPQALCALLDCEASKVTVTAPVLDEQGKPVLDKKGKPMTRNMGKRWKADSYNAGSNAAGLTQFLAGTWLTHVLRRGFYIHEQAVKAGWVRQEAGLWEFVLSDGRTTSRPWQNKTDANVKACLDKRFDATWSIHAAADYGAANLKVLENKGFKLSGLNDMDKAKLMYLMHHEGEGHGPAFASDTLKTEKLKHTFDLQVGKELADDWVSKADGDVAKAYRAWFGKYVDDQFGSSNIYFCSDAIVPKDLSDLLLKIGGKEIPKVNRK